MVFGFNNLPIANGSYLAINSAAFMNNAVESANVTNNGTEGGAGPKLSPASLKRARADSSSVGEGPNECKKQRSDDGEVATECYMVSILTGKRKRVDTMSREEMVTCLKKLKISTTEHGDMQEKKTSWDLVDEGVTWAKTGKLDGPWSFNVFSWNDVQGGKIPKMCECEDCKWVRAMDQLIPKPSDCGCDQ